MVRPVARYLVLSILWGTQSHGAWLSSFNRSKIQAEKFVIYLGAQCWCKKQHKVEKRWHLQFAASKSWFHCSHPLWGAVGKSQETLKEHCWREQGCRGSELITWDFGSYMLECPNSWLKQVYFHFSSPLPCFVWRILSFTLSAMKWEKRALFKLPLNNVSCVRTVLDASTLAFYWMELNSVGYYTSAYR